MKTIFCLGILILGSAAFAGDVIGRWKTIDDETGKPKSIVEIFKVGDEFHGKIAELIEPKEPDPKCLKCTGDKKDQPVRGLEIMDGMKETQAGKEWEDGHILDPNNGKTYKCRLKLNASGDQLEVRGFIGFSLIGRSQTWLKEAASEK